MMTPVPLKNASQKASEARLSVYHDVLSSSCHLSLAIASHGIPLLGSSIPFRIHDELSSPIHTAAGRRRTPTSKQGGL